MRRPIERALLLLLLVGGGCAATERQKIGMSDEQLLATIAEHSSDLQRDGTAARFVFDGVEMLCIYDTKFDRMRIITPIARIEAITPQHIGAAMTANFHTALDARYAISGGVLYAAYLHPLSSLGDGELLSALRQVASLAKTFGTTFSSGELLFPGAPPPTDGAADEPST